MANTSEQLSAYAGRVKPLAAICAKTGDRIDSLIDPIIQQLRLNDHRIIGLQQRLVSEGVSGCSVRLQSINTGELHRITQNLGAGSVSCNIDIEAMDRVALSLMAELNEEVELLFVNRFGKRESQGSGFCGVIERAIELSIPVLTVVREGWQESWLDYGGEWVATLPAEHASILSWCEQVLQRGVTKTA
ncbi:MAG: DUF2478 domain-containing protein [Granulosicoccus sp.]